MTTAVIAALLILGAVVLVSFATRTAIGQCRRWGGLAVVVIAGLLFPLAWVAWYSHVKAQGPVVSPLDR